MLVQKYKDMLSGKSVIRQLSEFATARGQEIGYENVFDYSLGSAYDQVCNDLFILDPKCLYFFYHIVPHFSVLRLTKLFRTPFAKSPLRGFLFAHVVTSPYK